MLLQQVLVVKLVIQNPMPLDAARAPQVIADDQLLFDGGKGKGKGKGMGKPCTHNPQAD